VGSDAEGQHNPKGVQVERRPPSKERSRAHFILAETTQGLIVLDGFGEVVVTGSCIVRVPTLVPGTAPPSGTV
jgi:hypothetical protein